MDKKTVYTTALEHSIRVQKWALEILKIGEWQDPPIFGPVDSDETDNSDEPESLNLVFPCDPTAYLTQEFGKNPQMYGQFGLDGHNGVDYAAPEGSPIKSVTRGEVIFADVRTTGYGRNVRIQHPGFVAIYGHLLDLDVRKGDKVKAGDVLGGMGGNPKDKYSGNSSGVHLHFEVRPDGEPVNNGYGGAVDPMPYLLLYKPRPKRTGIVRANALNVRASYHVQASKINLYRKNDRFSIIGQKQEPHSLWFKLNSLRDEWLAAKYYGHIFAKEE